MIDKYDENDSAPDSYFFLFPQKLQAGIKS